MNTKNVGDASEAAIIAELVSRGYPVSLPFGDNDPYDLVLDAAVGLLRVQVKTGWLVDDRVRFKTGSQTTRNGDPVVEGYTPAEVDAFAVRCRDTDTLYWVPFSEIGKKNTYLRVGEPEIDHPSVKRAADYRFGNNLPPLERND